MDMKCELKDKWLGALRSGRYKQGQWSLQKEDKFCCLGVLCEVAGVEKRVRRDGTIEYRVPSSGSWTSGETPLAIAGLHHDWCYKLANMNDNGYSFKKIAKVIEAEVPCEIE